MISRDVCGSCPLASYTPNIPLISTSSGLLPKNSVKIYLSNGTYTPPFNNVKLLKSIWPPQRQLQLGEMDKFPCCDRLEIRGYWLKIGTG